MENKHINRGNSIVRFGLFFISFITIILPVVFGKTGCWYFWGVVVALFYGIFSERFEWSLGFYSHEKIKQMCENKKVKK